MRVYVSAELLKLRSTRTTVALVAAMVALVLLSSLLTSLLGRPAELGDAQIQRSLLGIGSIASVFSALTGTLLVTSEYRYGTIRPSSLFASRRAVLLAAKLAVGCCSGLVLGIIAEALAFSIGLSVLSERAIPFALSSTGALQLGLGTVASAGLWGVIGVGLGAIIRNQVGAIVGLLAWVFVVENIVFALAPSVGRFSPGRAQDALVGMSITHLLAPGEGALVLVAWAAVLALGGLRLSIRRDIA